MSAKMKNLERILATFDRMYPDAKCELIHSNSLELLIAVMLSAQTTDKMVNTVTPALFSHYKDAKDYANASLSEIESYIKKIGLYRNKAKNIILMCQQLLDEYNGEVPCTIEELTSLAGVGRKTANVVLADAFNIPALAVDTHVARISKRLGFCYLKDDVTKIEEKLRRKVPKDRWIKTHHQMIFFGRYHCKAQAPNCFECDLVDICREKKKRLKNT